MTRDALLLVHLPLVVAIALATARRLFSMMEREQLIQEVPREALVCSALLLRSRLACRPPSVPLHR